MYRVRKRGSRLGKDGSFIRLSVECRRIIGDSKNKLGKENFAGRKVRLGS